MIDTLLIRTSPVGSGLQPKTIDLTTISGLTPSNDDLIQRKTGLWVNRSVAQYGLDLAPAWIAYGVVLTGSAIAAPQSATINYAKYCQIGKEVFVEIDLTMTNGVGTIFTSGWIVWTLPVPAAVVGTTTGAGIGWVYDTSASAFYGGVVELNTVGTQYVFMQYTDGNLNHHFGENVGARYITVSNGDLMGLSFQYEAA